MHHVLNLSPQSRPNSKTSIRARSAKQDFSAGFSKSTAACSARTPTCMCSIYSDVMRFPGGAAQRNPIRLPYQLTSIPQCSVVVLRQRAAWVLEVRVARPLPAECFVSREPLSLKAVIRCMMLRSGRLLVALTPTRCHISSQHDHACVLDVLI